MSRVLPILFNTDMVRAILDGRKTVTRRIIKDNVAGILNSPYHKEHPEVPDMMLLKKLCRTPYHPGDILYVRETLRVGAWDIRNQMIAFDYKDGTCGELAYIHDRKLFERLVDQSREDARKARCEYNGVDFVWEKGKSPCRWHPSIHMPKQAARIWLKVTDVRVERLQDITNEQILKEGIGRDTVVHYLSQFPENTEEWERAAHLIPFVELWNSTVKKKRYWRL